MTQPLIAVVDDDPAMLQTTEAVLTEEGYNVVLWSEGKTAYDFIREKNPALAIVDLRMGHPKAGWITIHLLRLDPRTAGLPVLVCTGDTDYIRANQRTLRENGCEVLLKPFAVDDLLNKVSRMLEAAQQAGQNKPGNVKRQSSRWSLPSIRALGQRSRSALERFRFRFRKSRS